MEMLDALGHFGCRGHHRQLDNDRPRIGQRATQRLVEACAVGRCGSIARLSMARVMFFLRRGAPVALTAVHAVPESRNCIQHRLDLAPDGVDLDQYPAPEITKPLLHGSPDSLNLLPDAFEEGG